MELIHTNSNDVVSNEFDVMDGRLRRRMGNTRVEVVVVVEKGACVTGGECDSLVS